MRHAGKPGLQEVRTERNHQLRPAEVMVRRSRPAEERVVGRAHRFPGVSLVAQATRAAHRLAPAVDQCVEGAGKRRRYDRDAVATSLRA